MKKLLLSIYIAAIALCLSPPLTEAESVPAVSEKPGAGSEAINRNAKYQDLAQELRMLQEGLVVKQAELAKLHHKWAVSKGRTPTSKELKTFEEKRAKGVVKVEDNPYVNKSPLSSPGRWRAAYYEKLAEIKRDKERSIRLEQELAELKR